MTVRGRRSACGQHPRLQSLAEPAHGPECVREPPTLQRPLHAARVGAHVPAPPGQRCRSIDAHDTVCAANEPHELVLAASLATTQTCAGRDMAHVPADGGSASAAVASASAAVASGAPAGSAREASHSAAAA